MKYLSVIIIFTLIFTGCLSGGSGGISFGGGSSVRSSSSAITSSTAAVDSTAPTVTNVNSNTAAATYGIGAVIDVRITFSEAVTVTGTPVITLETGTTDRNASYASGTGTTELVFNYTVQASDISADLDYALTTSLALSGGTIKDAAGNNATLTLVAPAATGSLGANEAIVVDGRSKVLQLALGSFHTCAILSTGAVRCWGRGTIGQLGYGNTNNIGDNETPLSAGDVLMNGTPVQIVAGGFHTCALFAHGAVQCWGQGAAGKLGYGTTDNVGDDETADDQGDVTIGGTVIQLAAGYEHTCALLVGGTVRCWGRAGDGQLGYGNTNDIGDDELPNTVGDVSIHATEKVIRISAGTYHTCAILESGNVRCWGWNGVGQLGYGHTNDIGDDELPSTAGNVDIHATEKVIQVVGGDAHTCALLANGNVRCWGDGSDGILGYGNGNAIGDDEMPSTAGDVSVHATESVKQIVTGYYHSCALLANGAVRCWGSGVEGALGYGNTNNIGDDEFPSTAGNVSIGGTVIKLFLGEKHSCALLDSGEVRCWGNNTFGQLGYAHTNAIGDDELPSTAGDVTIGSSQAVRQIVTSYDHNCAILATGKIKCWGANNFGQLGYGNTNNIGDNELPSSVGEVDVGGTVIQLAMGDSHTCALLATGSVKCWGRSASGELGYGNTTTIGDDELPSSVGNVNIGGSVIQIDSRDHHTCVLLATGAIRCWGNGSDGKLGYGNFNTIGDNEDPATAGDVSIGAVPAIQVAVGQHHTCALLSDRTVKCWGEGGNGALGYGNGNNIGDDELPSAVGVVNVGRSVTQLAVGQELTCALLDNGAIRCWGQGGDGALGYGNTNDIGDNEDPATAGDVSVGAAAIQVVTGFYHVCALLATGAVRCWGDNNSGQLGYGNLTIIGDDELPSTAGNVSVGANVIQLSGGDNQTCALLGNYQVKCWGENDRGQSGQGNTTYIGDNELPSTAGNVSVF